jgi:transposase InsO family protein
MSQARVAVLKVISKQATAGEAAKEIGISRRHLQRLLARYREGGLEALQPRSRRPRRNSNQTPERVRRRVIELRVKLASEGLDAGALTIAWHLEQEGLRPPSDSTIRRILHAEGLIEPQPRKRPRSSYARFEAAQPNETWQSDSTHWRLADGSEVEILNWLDDHSRYLLRCSAHQPVDGETVVSSFLEVVEQFGAPASTLTDNACVYTARFTGGRNGFEYLLSSLGVRQKNGSPGHPQTQGKIERFHQTLKRWLAARPAASDLAELQHQLDAFGEHYNEGRPHRALGRRTPGETYRKTPKALPPSRGGGVHWRLRYDRVDGQGKVSFRRGGRMHHLGIGRTHSGKRVLALADAQAVSVIELATGEVLSTHEIDPGRSYWRNRERPPGWRPDARG